MSYRIRHHVKDAFHLIPTKESRQLQSARNGKKRDPLGRLYVIHIYGQGCELFFRFEALGSREPLS
jgi:hypothetical protein